MQGMSACRAGYAPCRNIQVDGNLRDTNGILVRGHEKAGNAREIRGRRNRRETATKIVFTRTIRIVGDGVRRSRAAVFPHL